MLTIDFENNIAAHAPTPASADNLQLFISKKGVREVGGRVTGGAPCRSGGVKINPCSMQFAEYFCAEFPACLHGEAPYKFR